MTHALQLLNDRSHAIGSNQKNAVRQPPENVLGQFLSREDFLRENRILGVNQANASVKFGGNARRLHARTSLLKTWRG